MVVRNALAAVMLASSSALMADQPRSETMLTRWGRDVSSENAWREYPRPQMVRENWTCLNGDWDYGAPSKLG